MIKFENLEVTGWAHAVRGMRNPMNSWDKSDSEFDLFYEACGFNNHYEGYLGENDLALMKKLRNAGPDHGKFMRKIVVYIDITAPLYWWKEFDTYKVGTVANSCSTMHKIHAKEFTTDDFSTDTIANMDSPFYMNVLLAVIDGLNTARKRYLELKDGKTQFDVIEAKDQWRAMIELLPTSYNQKRTVMLNYEVLRNIYRARKNHKLKEWHDLCDLIETLPYSELITGPDEETSFQQDLDSFVNDCTDAQLEALYKEVEKKLKEKGLVNV